MSRDGDTWQPDQPLYEGESYLAELNAQAECEKLVQKLTPLCLAVAKQEAKDPNDKRLVRGGSIINKLEAELWGWLHAYLVAWRPDRSKKSN